MKKATILLMHLLAVIFVYGQEEMSLVWEGKLDHEITYTGTGLENQYSYAADDKNITVFDNNDGKVVWTGKYKEIAPNLRKIDELIPFWDSKTIFLFERKMGKDQIACIDLNTGKTYWTTDKYQNVSGQNVLYIPEKEGFAIALKDRLVFVKTKTGEEVWSTSIFKGTIGKYIMTDDDHIVMVNFKPTGLEALFTGFKNQIVKINLNNGDIAWESTYIGIVQKKLITREVLCDLEKMDDKIVLRLNGIQVYDYNTGASVWSAAFNYVPDGKLVGAPSGTKAMGVYGAVADPVMVNDQDLYVLDMSNKKNQYIKKYDLNSGKLLWTSPEIQDAKAIPNLVVKGDYIALQIGGAVDAQAYIVRKVKSGDGFYWEEEYRRWFPNVKPMGIQGFSSKDGRALWQSERFKKGITNSISVGDNFIVCSGKALYSMDMATGNENYEVYVKDGGVGDATLILPYEENIVVVGEKGISTYNAASGKPVANGKYKSSSLEDMIDNILIMKTASADIAAFDLNTCNYKEFKARKGATTTLSTSGEFVYVYEKKKIYKVKTF